MKEILTISVFSCCIFLSCKDDTTISGHTDYLLLKEKVVALESKVDSLIRVLNEKQTINTLQKQKKKVKNPTPSLANQSVSSNKNNYTWEKPQTSVTPTYKPKKETQLYQVRVGAICCDGSRSYATGRGACSHHGGVCKWLYE